MGSRPGEGRFKEIFSGTVPQSISDPILVFAAFLVLYAVTFDHSYFYDSVLYSGIIRSPLGLNKLSVVFEWNHFLWYPVTRCFYLLLRALGFGGLTYEAIQWFNAGAGALGLALFFSLLSGPLSRRLALFWTLLAGVSNVYWSRATGAEPYLAGTLFTLLFCAALARYFRRFSLGAFAWLCVFAGLASVFHIANNILWAAAAAALLYHRKEFLKQGAVLSGIFLAFSLPYAAVHGFFVRGGLARWWQWGSGLVNGVSPETNPLGQFELDLFSHILLPVKNLLLSFFYFTGWPAGAALAAAAVFAVVLAARAGDKEEPLLTPENTPLAAAFGLPFALFLLLYSVWQPGNTIYWATNVVLCAGFAAALFQGRARALTGRLLPAAGFAFAGFMACSNFARLILPNYLGKPVKPAIEFCKAVAYFTYPDSPVFISGGALKVYLPYFSNRERISLQLAVMNAYADKKDPVAQLKGILASYYEHGIPVYMTQDVLTDRGAYAQWGVSAGQLDGLLAPYRLMKVFQYDGEGGASNSLYLLWPKKPGGAAREAVFANMNKAGMQKHVLAIKRFIGQGEGQAPTARYLLEK
jgi:hypothetical protein